MRVITHCPACQTQFFATDEQLNKHGGKVRCGQCMHVFDARTQLITVAEQSEETPDNASTDDLAAHTATSSVAVAELEAESAPGTPPADPVFKTTAANLGAEASQQQPSFLDDAGSRFKAQVGTRKPRRWLWGFASLLLILTAGLQSVYFLRDEIAIFYPVAKPYLIQACETLSCNINLPKKIEFVIIDDSDMQEDTDRAGLVRFASTLINHGQHVVAYPNLELTLTDLEDTPVIRRVFKPAEYLPAGTDVAEGIAAGAEIRIKMTITTSNITVSGYRVFVTY